MSDYLKYVWKITGVCVLVVLAWWSGIDAGKQIETRACNTTKLSEWFAQQSGPIELNSVPVKK